MPGGRGGRRTGTPGVAYTNRSDLNRNRTAPIAAPTGLEYGQHKDLIDAERAAAPAPASPPAVRAAPAGGAAPVAAAPMPLPGSLPPLNRPSERPGEPLTSGAPVGAGPGPEALGVMSGSLADVIASAAASSRSSDLQFLADQARRMGQ